MAQPDPSIYNSQTAGNDQITTGAPLPGGSYNFSGMPQTNTKPGAVTGPSPAFAPAASASPAQYSPQAQYAPDVGFNANAQGTGEQVSSAFLNHYGTSGIPSVSNNAQGAYDSWSQTAGPAPGDIPARDMSAYYNNASQQQANAINRQMAARGSYGSSNAIGNLAQAETNLRAQQARDEAQYGLQRGQYELQRGQYGLSRAGLAGQLANAADASSLAASGNERNWMSGLTDLGFQNQRTSTNRFLTGLGLEQDAADRASGMVGETYGKEIDQQRDLLIQQLMASGMSANDAATAANNRLQASQAQDQRVGETLTAAASYGASKYLDKAADDDKRDRGY